MMAHLLLIWAPAGIQLGTRFIMTSECMVHDDFKAAFKKAQARDAVATPPVRLTPAGHTGAGTEKQGHGRIQQAAARDTA